MVKRLTKERSCITQEHRQQCEDWLGVRRGWNWEREEEERKLGTTVPAQTIKKNLSWNAI